MADAIHAGSLSAAELGQRVAAELNHIFVIGILSSFQMTRVGAQREVWIQLECDGCYRQGTVLAETKVLVG